MWKIILNKYSPYLAIGVLCFILWQTHSQVTKYQHKANTLEATISDLNQEIKYTKIQLNDSIALYQAEVKSLNMTQNNLQAKYNNLLAASKVKPKDISNVTSTIHSVDTVIAVIDSFGGIKAKLEDDFVDIDVEVLPDKKTIIDYEVRDSLTILSVQKKHSWLFGLIKWKDNPKAEIVSLQTIDIIEK